MHDKLFSKTCLPIHIAVTLTTECISINKLNYRTQQQRKKLTVIKSQSGQKIYILATICMHLVRFFVLIQVCFIVAQKRVSCAYTV